MKGFRMWAVFGILLVSILMVRDAQANLSYHCEFRTGIDSLPDPAPVYPWHAQHVTVPVFASSLNPPWTAAGMTQSQFERLLQRILAAQNEQLGSTVRYRYDGVSSSSTYIVGAILIFGDTTGCNNGFNFTDIYSSSVRGTYRWKAATITVMKYLACPSGLIDYTDIEVQNGSKVDLGYTLMHELGHAYGSDHPDNTNNPNCSYFGQESYMLGGYEKRPPAWRTIKDYDAEVAQFWYGARSNGGQMFKNMYTAANTWSVAGAANHLLFGPGVPLFRPGSMSQDVNYRSIAWLYNPSSGVNALGGGTLSFAQYKGPSTPAGTIATDGLRRPIAVAANTTPGHDNDRIMAYQRYESSSQAPYVSYSDDEIICYRRSSDGGVTWSGEACPSAITRRYGITATYDPYSNTFLIGYIADSYLGPYNPPQGGSDDSPYVAVLVIPSGTNTTTPSQITTTVGTSYEAPGIACSGTSTGCRIVYDDAVTQQLVWFNAGVAPSTGLVSTPSAYIQGYLQYDTPSIAYDPGDSLFHLATVSNNNAIYSYSMSTAGTSWSPTGDIWNSTGSYVSAAALSVRKDPSGVRSLYAWWPKFF